MPRAVSRWVEVANERVVGALFFVAMAAASVQGPTWQSIATGGGAIVVGISGWAITDRLSQQTERDRKQDLEMKEALAQIVASHEKASAKQEANVLRLTDSVESIANKTHDTAIKSLELGMVVKELQDSVSAMRAKLDAREQRELEELRKARESRR